MTLNYNKDIMTSKPWTYLSLLFCWKASIWKAVYVDLFVYLLMYYAIDITYRTAMSEDQQRSLERVVKYFDQRLSYIPLELVLAFFVTQVHNRWTKLYQSIGFIDNIGLMAALYVRGTDEKGRMYRRNILRYSQLVQVLIFRDISMRTRRRFPTLDTVVAAGFMMEHEKEIFESYDDHGRTPKYWIPANWAYAMTYKAWKSGHIESAYYKVAMQNQLRTWRTDLEWVCNYDWVPYPLMYPQVVWLAVHFYFLVSIVARQLIVDQHKDKLDIDSYFPFMTVLQFVFYMGWVKVAAVMLNPFGEDDDDFETNALIDRNITMGLMIVDQGYNRPPELRRDPFWDEIHPLYSEETAKIKNHPQQGSLSHIRLGSNVKEVVMVPHAREKGEPEPVSVNPRRSTVRVKEEDRYVPGSHQPPKEQSRTSGFIDSMKSFFDRVYRSFTSFVKRLFCNFRHKRMYDAQSNLANSPKRSPVINGNFVRAVSTTPPPTISIGANEREIR